MLALLALTTTERVLCAGIIVAAAACLALGRAIGRRERPTVAQQQLAQAIHPPEVRGRVVDMAEWRRTAPRFNSTRRG